MSENNDRKTVHIDPQHGDDLLGDGTAKKPYLTCERAMLHLYPDTREA